MTSKIEQQAEELWNTFLPKQDLEQGQEQAEEQNQEKAQQFWPAYEEIIKLSRAQSKKIIAPLEQIPLPDVAGAYARLPQTLFKFYEERPSDSSESRSVFLTSSIVSLFLTLIGWFTVGFSSSEQTFLVFMCINLGLYAFYGYSNWQEEEERIAQQIEFWPDHLLINSKEKWQYENLAEVEIRDYQLTMVDQQGQRTESFPLYNEMGKKISKREIATLSDFFDLIIEARIIKELNKRGINLQQ